MDQNWTESQRKALEKSRSMHTFTLGQLGVSLKVADRFVEAGYWNPHPIAEHSNRRIIRRYTYIGNGN